MRVALNVRNANLDIPDGAGESMRGLIGGLAHTNPGHSIELLADAPPRFRPPGDQQVKFRTIRPFPVGNRVLHKACGGDPWYRLRLGLEGRWRRWDAYVQNAHEPPPSFGLRARASIVFDVAFARVNATANFEAPTIAELHRWTSRNVHEAHAIITISESVARDVVRTYGVPRERVTVAYLGVDRTRFRQNHAAPTISECRARYGLDTPYLLFVGTVQPRKNIPTLVHSVVRARTAGLSTVLAVVGASGWQSEKSLETMASAGPQAVRYLGRVPADDLPFLMAGARAFVSLARTEGFGMPALEAMASGVPVVVANDAGLAEVVGDAGLRVDPEDPDDIARALVRITSDRVLRGNLISRGVARAAGFTWDAAGRSVWRAIEQACASC